MVLLETNSFLNTPRKRSAELIKIYVQQDNGEKIEVQRFFFFFAFFRVRVLKDRRTSARLPRPEESPQKKNRWCVQRLVKRGPQHAEARKKRAGHSTGPHIGKFWQYPTKFKQIYQKKANIQQFQKQKLILRYLIEIWLNFGKFWQNSDTFWATSNIKFN